jgi:hypothetical protein
MLPPNEESGPSFLRPYPFFATEPVLLKGNCFQCFLSRPEVHSPSTKRLHTFVIDHSVLCMQTAHVVSQSMAADTLIDADAELYLAHVYS